MRRLTKPISYGEACSSQQCLSICSWCIAGCRVGTVSRSKGHPTLTNCVRGFSAGRVSPAGPQNSLATSVAGGSIDPSDFASNDPDSGGGFAPSTAIISGPVCRLVSQNNRRTQKKAAKFVDFSQVAALESAANFDVTSKFNRYGYSFCGVRFAESSSRNTSTGRVVHGSQLNLSGSPMRSIAHDEPQTGRSNRKRGGWRLSGEFSSMSCCSMNLERRQEELNRWAIVRNSLELDGVRVGEVMKRLTKDDQGYVRMEALIQAIVQSCMETQVSPRAPLSPFVVEGILETHVNLSATDRVSVKDVHSILCQLVDSTTVVDRLEGIFHMLSLSVLPQLKFGDIEHFFRRAYRWGLSPSLLLQIRHDRLPYHSLVHLAHFTSKEFFDHHEVASTPQGNGEASHEELSVTTDASNKGSEVVASFSKLADWCFRSQQPADASESSAKNSVSSDSLVGDRKGPDESKLTDGRYRTNAHRLLQRLCDISEIRRMKRTEEVLKTHSP
eukprot:Filipodium_phascolosomae@DN3780_c0_g1_i1.p1